MSGEALLTDSGAVSHENAIEKATSEYKKYQSGTLSEVEKAYLDNLKQLEKDIDRKKKKQDHE